MSSQSFLPYLAHDSFSQLGPVYQGNLKDILKNPNIKVDDNPEVTDFINSMGNNVLNFLSEDKKVIQFVKSHHPQVIEFICSNIDSFISISFDSQEKNKKKSKTALSILLSPDCSIHEALIDNSTRVLEKATNLALSKDDNNHSFRIVLQLINFTIQMSHYIENQFPECLSFILKFINKIDENCIYDFFESMCSNNECYESVQKWLINETNFPATLIEELSKSKTNLKKIIESEGIDTKLINSIQGERENDNLPQKEDIEDLNQKEEGANQIDKDILDSKEESMLNQKEEEENTIHVEKDNLNLKDDDELKQKKDEEENANQAEKCTIDSKKEEEENSPNEKEKGNIHQIVKDITDLKEDNNSNHNLIENNLNHSNNSLNSIVNNKETEMIKATNLLNIISLCLTSPIMYENFQDSKLINLLSDEWKGLNITDALFDLIWVVVSNIISEKTVHLLQYFIQKAIQQIKEPFTTPKRFRVCSIDIISLIFDVDESYIPIISSAHLEKDVLRLLKQFPDKTFLEIALLQLCNKAFHIPELKDQFIDALIVPFIGGVKEQPETFVDRILIGFTFEILSTILNSNQSQNDEKEDFMNKIKAIPGYEDFENNFFKKRTRLMRIGYGGKRPIYRTKSTPYPF